MGYLTPRALRGLKQYKYKAGGYTWLDDLHQPFWNGIVDRLPHWLAPNLITLFGLALLASAYLATVYHCADLRGDGAPRWVFAFMGLSTLAYLHLDCLDGKQARRTASASPLGQLFDHGCDALCVHLLLVGIAPTLDVGLGTKWSFGGQLAVAGPWLAAHWEEYHCGEMLYGNGWWGVTEANYVLVALHFVSAAFGPGIWSRRAVDVAPSWAVRGFERAVALVFDALGALTRRGKSETPSLKLLFAPLKLLASATKGNRRLLALSSSPSSLALASSFVERLRINDLLLCCIGGCGVLQITTQLWRIYGLDSGKSLPRAERGNKSLGLRNATSHLLQLSLVVAVGVASMGEPLLSSHGGGGIRSAKHVRAAFAAFGIAYALEATKLIMDHMSKEPFNIVVWPMATLAAGAAHGYACRQRNRDVFGVSPDAVVALNLVVISVGYLHYVTSVISQTCSYLGIKCLTIDAEKALRAKRQARAEAEAATRAARTSDGTTRSAASVASARATRSRSRSSK